MATAFTRRLLARHLFPIEQDIPRHEVSAIGYGEGDLPCVVCYDAQSVPPDGHGRGWLLVLGTAPLHNCIWSAFWDSLWMGGQSL